MKSAPDIESAAHLLSGLGLESGALRHGYRMGSAANKEARPQTLRRANPSHPEDIDEFVLDLMVRVRRNHPTPGAHFIARREGIAKHLGVPNHFVDQSFERLKQRGFLRTPANDGAHDSPRSRLFPGNLSSWSGTIWPINLGKLDAYIAELPAPEPSRPASRARMRP